MITVTNKTNFVLHGALSWAGNQDWCFNDLAQGASVPTNKFNLGWKDLTVVLGMAGNRFDPKRDGERDFGKMVLHGASLLATGLGPGGLLLGPRRGGTGSEPAVGYTSLIPMPMAPKIWSLVPGPSGAGTGNFKLAKAPFIVEPVSVGGLFVSDGYDIEITGCEFHGTFNSREEFVITEVVPLSLKWKNLTSHNEGTVVGIARQTEAYVLD